MPSDARIFETVHPTQILPFIMYIYCYEKMNKTSGMVHRLCAWKVLYIHLTLQWLTIEADTSDSAGGRKLNCKPAGKECFKVGGVVVINFKC